MSNYEQQMRTLRNWIISLAFALIMLGVIAADIRLIVTVVNYVEDCRK